jgi:FKBP-type peptidyl-prolyl cis-trans isomerase
MTRVLILLALAGVLAACGGEGSIPPRQDFMATIPKEAGPDPDFKPFPENDPKVVTLPSGTKYIDLQDGVPHGKVVSGRQEVKVHYAGWRKDGKRFDASYVRGTEPATFSLINPGGVINGWCEGLQGMKEGGKRLFSIPAKEAYGEQGYGPDIPPNTDLIFEIWLCEIVRDLPAPAETPKATDVDHPDHAGRRDGEVK